MFCLRTLYWTLSSSYHNRYSFECADILVPITSFLYCLIGITLTIYAVAQFRLWRRAYRMNIFDLLNEYYDTLLHPTKGM